MSFVVSAQKYIGGSAPQPEGSQLSCSATAPPKTDEVTQQIRSFVLSKFHKIHREKVRELGKPRRADSPNTSLVSALCRIAMRQPSDVVIERLWELHQKLNDALNKKWSNEALEWLRSESASTSPAGFSTVSELRNFLSQDPKQISTSRLISGLQNILTAMGYRSVDHTLPTTPDEKEMAQFLILLIRDQWVENINSAYPERRADLLMESARPMACDDRMECLGEARGDISEISDSETAPVPTPRVRFHKKFRKFRVGNFLNASDTKKSTLMLRTWVGSAARAKIPIRSHVSGTATLVSAVIVSLLKNSPWFGDEKNVEQFIGAICLAPFERGDFHSIPETMAGIHYYLSQRSKEMGKPSASPVLQPREAYDRGIKLLLSIIKPEYLPCCKTVAHIIMGEAADVPFDSSI